MRFKRSGILTGTAGVYFVASQLAARGFHAAPTFGNAPSVDILVGMSDGAATLSLQVKTTMHATRSRGQGTNLTLYVPLPSLHVMDMQKIVFCSSLSDLKAQSLATGVVLATYRGVKHESDGRKTYYLRSSVWKLINGRWQMIFHQGTLIETDT